MLGQHLQEDRRRKRQVSCLQAQRLRAHTPGVPSDIPPLPPKREPPDIVLPPPKPPPKPPEKLPPKVPPPPRPEPPRAPPRIARN